MLQFFTLTYYNHEEVPSVLITLGVIMSNVNTLAGINIPENFEVVFHDDLELYAASGGALLLKRGYLGGAQVDGGDGAYGAAQELMVGNAHLNHIIMPNMVKDFAVVIHRGSFELLSPQAQQFMIAHELGHYYSGHIARYEAGGVSSEEAETMEVQADAWAAGFLGSSTAAIGQAVSEMLAVFPRVARPDKADNEEWVALAVASLLSAVRTVMPHRLEVLGL